MVLEESVPAKDCNLRGMDHKTLSCLLSLMGSIVEEGADRKKSLESSGPTAYWELRGVLY